MILSVCGSDLEQISHQSLFKVGSESCSVKAALINICHISDGSNDYNVKGAASSDEDTDDCSCHIV